MESLHAFRFWHLGTFFRKALKLEVVVGAGSTYLYELKKYVPLWKVRFTSSCVWYIVEKSAVFGLQGPEKGIVHQCQFVSGTEIWASGRW